MDDVAMVPPFLTASLSRASAAVVPGAPTALEAHALEDLGDGVAHGRRGRQRQVDDAELGAEHLRGLPGDRARRRA